MKLTQLIIGCLVVVTGVTPVPAAVQIFTDRVSQPNSPDRSAFLAEVANLGITLSYEGFNTAFTANPGPLVYSDFAVVGVNLTSDFFSDTDARFVSEGARAIGYTALNSGTSVIFDFTEPINVFGIDINDWGTIGSGILQISNNTGTFSEQWEVDPPGMPSWELGERLFFGAVDTQPFSSVTVFADTGLDRIGLDDLTYGQLGVDQIPEPSSLLIWSLIGTAGFGYVARRRRQHRVSC